MNYREDIEQLAKNTFDNFESEVSPHVWVNIQNGLNIQPASNSGTEGNIVSTGTKLTSMASKVSVVKIIGTAATIIGITASAIYFSSDKESAINNPVNETKTIENRIPAASTETESKEIINDHNEKKAEQSSASLKQLVPDNKETASANKTDYYSSTNDDNPVVALDKKDIKEVVNEKNKEADLKLAETSMQNSPTDVDEKKSMENSLAVETSPSPEAEAEATATATTTTPEQTKEKNTVECLGHIRNVFTPNGDGDNDVFIIEGNDLLNLNVTIVEQATGKIIHQWNNLHGFWDGKTENGQSAKEGMYIYNIFAQPKTGKPITKTGTLHLILN